MADERDAADPDRERDPVSMRVPLDSRIAGESVDDGWTGDRGEDPVPRDDRSEGPDEDARAWGTMLADTAGAVGAFMETALDSIPWLAPEPESEPVGDPSPADMRIKFQPEETDLRPGGDGESTESGHQDVIES